MADIAGVKTEKNAHNKLTHKHPQTVASLKETGLTEKTQFEKDCEDAISVEETFKQVYAHIGTLPWEKK